jgi:chromosome segregation ATPase
VGLAEGQAISNDSRIVELLELLAKNQMNAQAEQVKQMCDYVGTLEKQIVSMTEEIKSVRKELVSMKEDTIAKHVKDSLKKAADTLQKQCDSLKQQIKEVKQKICERAGKIVDAAKRKGQKALYKITQVTGMRKKLAAVKDKVDKAINSVENLEKAVGECYGQQERSSLRDTPLPDCAVAEPQVEYGAELFEQYQREHGRGQTVQAAGQTVKQEVEKRR